MRTIAKTQLSKDGMSYVMTFSEPDEPNEMALLIQVHIILPNGKDVHTEIDTESIDDIQTGFAEGWAEAYDDCDSAIEIYPDGEGSIYIFPDGRILSED